LKSKNSVITGNYFNKYKSKNLLYSILVNHYRFALQSLIQDLPIDTCLEIGSGEGYIIDYILSTKPEIQIIGSDIGFSVVSLAKTDRQFVKWCVSDGKNIPITENSFDIVFACEVLEHIDKPIDVLKEINRVSKKYVIISVPFEPFWRIMNIMRLKYLSSLGNTPGHINHWSINGITKLVEVYFQPIDVRISFPWIFIKAQKR